MGNSKAISLLFGLIVGVISTFSAYILAEMEPTKLGSITIISFASSTLLFAIITEYLFDRKIALIYKSFDKLKKFLIFFSKLFKSSSLKALDNDNI